MGCFAVPLVGAVLCHAWRKSGKGRNTPQNFWLNLMLLGGAIFGVVDHWWNGELFLISDNLPMDLALGFAILLTTLAAWGLLVKFAAVSPVKSKDIV